MLDSYVDAIQQHVNESIEDLELLNELLKDRNWTRVERKGAERLIQTLVEACIGVSKHWLKKQKKVLPSDAYSVFEKLMELGLISHKDAGEWQRIIGMRNAIVHDYLNLDEKLIRAIVENKMYLKLQTFALDISNQLRL
ncbi:type VII toxin-antitoxin system HepT family RNase toxin [Thalassotalea sp. PLHSN55]|uniref:type VII toxin-antitoxin system HepT family RNase toxin n=1 Tax=Thalassotalea sp. PLHSN55 TaxID=3435888 RepID=UPI003F83FE37